MFRLEINTGNSAFEDRNEKIARILEAVAEKLRSGRDGGNCVDINGNVVGSFELEED